MPTVELVYDSDCPNVADARAQLLRAFAETKIAPRWQEWQGDDADSPARVRGYGSPTILVDGIDVAETDERGGPCCRLYAQPDGSMRGVPSVETLVAALKACAHAGPIATSGGENWKLNFAMLPGIGAAFLPKVACPACWPAYAGFLSSIGLGFLAVAVFALAFRARRRRGHGPFVLGAAASAIVLIGKFSFESNPAMYAGLALLVGATLRAAGLGQP
ncbi:MAG: hypothetical protein JRH14_23045 [Deltaproteobacteria bacterium]|nr:hypothetical protein [Deltaproteobacteria bacterium]